MGLDSARRTPPEGAPAGRGGGSRWLLVPVALALLFALRALGLIEASSLWGDELSTARKAFQPSLAYLLDYLRTDTHPPLYYGLLWAYGRVGPQTAMALRLFSWFSYLLGGLTMTASVVALAAPLPPGRRRVAIGTALVLAFCTPFPVRFSIEAKGYAFLVLGVALSLWTRSLWLARGRPRTLAAYGLAVAAASLTHYYGLFHGLALVATDAFRLLALRERRRIALAGTAALAVLPSIAWVWHSRRFLVQSSAAGDWIGTPDPALLEDTLQRLLGPWPFPKLAVGLLVLWGYRTLARRRGWAPLGSGPLGSLPLEAAPARPPGGAAASPPPGWLDASGIVPGLLLVAGVVAVSFFKPMAFPRYFVVLLPALVSCASLALATLPAPPSGLPRRLVLATAVLVVALLWHDAFLPLDPGGVLRGSRETSDFRRLVLVTEGEGERFSPRPHHFRTARRLLVNAGRLGPDPFPWRDAAELADLAGSGRAPKHILLAETSGPRSVQRRIAPALESAEAGGYRCRRRLRQFPHLRLYACELRGEP